jgi:cellulose synthase/poly-beta-1,6-N-acetylglucosamine synthase-like glycosyltransferase
MAELGCFFDGYGYHHDTTELVLVVDLGHRPPPDQ